MNWLVRQVAMFSLATATVILAAGCGPRTEFATVEGTITQGGRPLPGVAVIFVPAAEGQRDAFRATGITNEEGSYTLVSDSGREGVVVGPYRVCLIDTRAIPMPKFSIPDAAMKKFAEAKVDILKLKTPKPTPSRLPLAYNDVERSPIPSVEAKPGKQVFTFDVPAVSKQGK